MPTHKSHISKKYSLSFLHSFITEEFRMRIKHIIATTALAFGLAVPAWAQAQSVAEPGQTLATSASTYDFAYRATDNRVNVFDDGKITRIQLPEGTLLPTLVAIQPKGEVLLHPKREGTYLVVEGIHQQLRLRWANAKDISVVYTGQVALNQRIGQAAAFGATTPSVQFGAAAKPVNVHIPPVVMKQDEQAPITKLESISSSAMTTVKKTSFVLNTDQPIHEALGDWAKQSGWHLVWQPDVSWRTLREASYTHLELVAAVDAVVSTLRSEGKPVALRVSDGNKVLEIISTEVRHDQQ
jgi:hypothetical protein